MGVREVETGEKRTQLSGMFLLSLVTSESLMIVPFFPLSFEAQPSRFFVVSSPLRPLFFDVLLQLQSLHTSLHGRQTKSRGRELLE